MNDLPSSTWESSMCVTFCLPSTQDTTSAIVAAGDTIDFSFHFFTDPLMQGPDTARARVRFMNDNGSQNPIYKMFRGITVENSTYILDNTGVERKLKMIIDILGRDSKPIPNSTLLYIYEDGTVEKRIIVD